MCNTCLLSAASSTSPGLLVLLCGEGVEQSTYMQVTSPGLGKKINLITITQTDYWFSVDMQWSRKQSSRTVEQKPHYAAACFLKTIVFISVIWAVWLLSYQEGWRGLFRLTSMSSTWSSISALWLMMAMKSSSVPLLQQSTALFSLLHSQQWSNVGAKGPSLPLEFCRSALASPHYSRHLAWVWVLLM